MNNLKIGDLVTMNGKYDDMPKDGKVYEVIKVGNCCGTSCVWIKEGGAFAEDGFSKVKGGVK